MFEATELNECLDDEFPLFEPRDDTATPYVIPGGNAFGLRTYLM